MPDSQNDAVIAMLQSMDVKIDRNFDQQQKGLTKMFDLFEEHSKDDKVQFGAIKEAVDVAKGMKQERDDQSSKSANAKLLAVTAVGGGSFIFELLRYLHVIK